MFSIASRTTCKIAECRSVLAPHLSTSVRQVHSNRQVNRLLRDHPAKLRIQKKLGIERVVFRPLPPRQFPAVFEPTLLPNGWSAPPETSLTDDLPFSIKRTKNKPADAVGFLPVYTKHRKDGTKIITRIKKVTGDRDLFIQEMRAVLEVPEAYTAYYEKVRIRVGGTIEVKGNHAYKIKEWLASMGF